MSQVELDQAFAKHLRERTDVDGCRDAVESVMEALDSSPEKEYWESRLRDAQWELTLAQKALKALEHFGPFTVHAPVGTGNLYLVNLDIKPCEYLQYDAPFSEQSQQVQTAMLKLAEDVQPGLAASSRLALAIEENASGRALYRALSTDHDISPITYSGGREASEALLNVGVQGIRYLDRTSREIDGDTFNYVVFDDSKITVIEERSAKQDDGHLHDEHLDNRKAMGMAM